MPGIQEIGPASTPQLYFENQFKLSQQQAAQQYQNWQNQYETGAIDIDTFTKEAQDLQTAADEQTAAFQSGMQMMQQSQKFVDLGLMSPEQHQEAMWEQVLPKEVFEKLYTQPEEGPVRVPFSPEKVEEYGDTIESFLGTISTIKRKAFGIDWLRRDLPKDPALSTILDRYDAWRTSIGYDAMTFSQQRQVDAEWDIWITKKDWAQWSPNLEAVKGRRAKGPLTRSFGAQFRGTPTGPREATNPLQVSIAADLPKRREPKPEPQAKIYARNKKTGKRLFSTDGGKTWQSE